MNSRPAAAPELVTGSTSCCVWSMARVAMKNETVCADSYLVKKVDSKILVAVVDGLGHGKKAFEASKYAISTLENFGGETIINLVNRCHRNLRHTRGVVMSLGVIDCMEKTLTWLGIGNVEGMLLSKESRGWQRKKHIILRGGVVGYELPYLKASIVPITEGDLLIFTTDGVDNEFLNAVVHRNNPLAIVKNVSDTYFKERDDALILALEISKNYE